MSEEPRIIELDPEAAPRTSAFILVFCALLGVGFLVVNVVFTGEDPYQTDSWYEDDPSIQEQGNIMPNLVRGKPRGGIAPEEEELVMKEMAKKAKPKPAATAPVGTPFKTIKPTTAPVGRNP